MSTTSSADSDKDNDKNVGSRRHGEQDVDVGGAVEKVSTSLNLSNVTETVVFA